MAQETIYTDQTEEWVGKEGREGEAAQAGYVPG